MEQNEPSNHYARVLRVIGQDLAALVPHQIEIVERGNSFFVHVRCDRKWAEGKAAAHTDSIRKSGLKSFFHKRHRTDQGKALERPATVSVDRSYTSIDISRLDAIGMDRRMQLTKIPDIHDLGEALRTIGRILDTENGRLVRILKDQHSVACEYIGRDGAKKTLEMTRAELIKAQKEYYHGRDPTITLDIWKGKP